MNVDLILLVVAFVCFALDALSSRVGLNTDIRLTPLGLALWVLTLIV